MCDCFNMAYQDNANALQLHIKVNNENLFPVSQKYNAGSLRIPADPSWPKIPQRKLANDIDDTIESPCVITLTGTPRKSRTIVQTPLNQSPKSVITKDSAYSSFCYQRTTSSLHTLKRLPGYVDPRFKKVTNAKKTRDTSTECSSNKEVEKSVPERDINVEQVEKQEAEKPHERGKTESPKVICDSESCIEVDKYVQDYTENNKFHRHPTLEQQQCTNVVESRNQNNSNQNESSEINKCAKSSSERTLKSTVNDANTQVDLTPSPMQENNGQLFFVLDKKLQSQPLNAIHLDTIAIPQEYVKQCYNVQVPVLTYQNIPVQVSTRRANDVAQQCLNNSEHENQSKNTTLIKQESEPPIHSINAESSNQCVQISSDQLQQTEKSIIHNAEEHIQDSKRRNTLRVQNSLKSNQKDPNIPERLQSTYSQQKPHESSDSEYYIPNVHKKNKYTNVLKMKSITCNTSCEETTDSELMLQKNIRRKDFLDNDKLATAAIKMDADTVHGDVKIQSHDRMNTVSKEAEYFESVPRSDIIITDQNHPSYSEYKNIIPEAETRNKSEQNLPCIKAECTRKLCHNSEPHITFKQRKMSAKFSKKAKSYFQKNSHSALMDSDYTLMWPNCQHSRHKRDQPNTHKSNNNRINKIDQQITNSSNFIGQSYARSNENMNSGQERGKNLSKTCFQKECCKCDVSPRSNTNDAIERPKGIPQKTQELLNKSYWDFYNKLRHKIKDAGNMEQQYPYQITMDTLEKVTKGKSTEVYNKELWNQLKLNPELQTLQQCSALSTMINKALDTNLQSDMQTKQLYINDSIKSSSNPTGGMQNVNVNKMISNVTDDEPIINKINCKTSNANDKQFLELKSIIFFGGMMYILIIFLPMLYDYFYHEEYDDYENLNYLELIMEYILSSFKEAFGDVVNGVKQIFFYLHSCKKCTNAP